MAYAFPVKYQYIQPFIAHDFNIKDQHATSVQNSVYSWLPQNLFSSNQPRITGWLGGGDIVKYVKCKGTFFSTSQLLMQITNCMYLVYCLTKD